MNPPLLEYGTNHEPADLQGPPPQGYLGYRGEPRDDELDPELSWRGWLLAIAICLVVLAVLFNLLTLLLARL